MKRFIVIIICSFLLTACTSNLWEKKSSYEETVLGFYLIENKREVLVVGEKYSYVFEVNSDMYQAFKLSSRIDFGLQFNYFKMSENNKTSGSVDLYVNKDKLSGSDIKILKGLNFTSTKTDSNTLELDGLIYGTRYTGEGNLPITTFEKGYKVSIAIPDSVLLHTGKVVATPVTLAFDVLVLTPIAFTGLMFLAATGTFN
jgi:hypothetical protein